MKKYNLVNNSLGWFCFLVAAVTYLLTIEPTASFWDCPEFISQGCKLEVGHPPGNPIFMLAARFFVNFAGGDPSNVAVAVNVMSALLSAGTILLLFWTITHLTRRLMVGRSEEALPLSKMIVVMGSGLCGALLYTWSDTFWFSAVEGEVYAFSSFCTALVFWLILKWDNRADKPRSDRYLILIAYVIGISIAVHLLNLLTIPAIALVVYFRKAKNVTLKRSLMALAGSFVVVALILYGLVPGFIENAQYFELFFVNEISDNPELFLFAAVFIGVIVIVACSIVIVACSMHKMNLLKIPFLGIFVFGGDSKKLKLNFRGIVAVVSVIVLLLVLYFLKPRFGYNAGVLIYSVLLVGVLIWTIRSLYRQQSLLQIRLSFILSVILSGIPFIGSSIWVPVVITCALVAYMFYSRRLSVRLLNIVALSILVIFVGYSSYALLLIRSHANPPMNQNAPDNVFALGSYLNREQYGDTPLLWGPSFASVPEAVVDLETGEMDYRTTQGKTEYSKVVKKSPDEPDRYVKRDPKPVYHMTPNMFFPRMYSTQPSHPQEYLRWINETNESLPKVEAKPYYDADGNVIKVYGREYTEKVSKPSFIQNMRYFFTYQLNHMYWRYFMWNFAGRQNDYQGQGELTRGNWISGIPFIDNARLGDQSLLPPDLGSENKGHNVFYMLPLLMGLLGIALQMVRGQEGVRQFWVVFFLFFMTGIAIVLYLNQPPLQPRERDYAFAGSFYAFSIWIGLGVYGLWLLLRAAIGKKKRSKKRVMTITAATAAVVGVLVPLQMVSQTWDDHDRSGRYTTRDFGMNYLSSLDKNAIIFTNGDNDTFPLWYAQEVEGYRTDVRVVNLAYLTTDWYVNQMRVPSYDAAGIGMSATPEDYAYDRLQMNYVDADDRVSVPVDVFSSLKDLYKSDDAVGTQGIRSMRYPSMYIPVNVDDAVKAGVIRAEEAPLADDYISVDLSAERGVNLSQVISLDMIATGVQNGWNRPAYFAITVPDNYYLNLSSNLRNTGLAYQVTPISGQLESEYNLAVATDKMYDNVMNKFRWGGLDKLGDSGTVYLDETVRRMVTTHRSTMIDLAAALYNEGIDALDSISASGGDEAEYSGDRFTKAIDVLELMDAKLPVKHSPYAIQVGQRIGNLYVALAEVTGRSDLRDKGLSILENEIMRYSPYVAYYVELIKDEQARRARQSSGSRFKTSVPEVTVTDLNVTSTEMYIPTYIYSLIQDYASAQGDIDRLEKRLNDANVNLSDLEGMLY